MSDITQTLEAVDRGGGTATRWLPLVYEELHKLAVSRMAHEPTGHTLQPTALVHEAWLRLVEAKPQPWENRAYFFSAAAEAMRRVLVDRARRKQAERHGGGWQRIELEMIDAPARADGDALLRVHGRNHLGMDGVNG